MSYIEKVVSFVQQADPLELRKYTLISLGGFFMVCAFIVYKVNERKEELLKEIQSTYALAKKSRALIDDNKQMQAEELRLKQLLDKNREFTIKGFFESFCRDQNLNPEPGWDARSEQVNDRFDEVLLPAEFKDQTTQKLIAVLDELSKKEIVYLKEVTVRNQSNGKISFGLTIATKRYKASLLE